MGDDHHRHALVRQLAHDVQHLADHLRVQGAGRLVEEHDLRLHRQGPHDGDPLFLPAGELGGVGVRLVLQPDAPQQGQRCLVRLRLLHQAGAHRGEGDVPPDAHIGEQVEVLEHHAHLPPHRVDVGLGVCDDGAVKGDAARGGRFQQVQAAEEGALAAAGGPDHDDLLSGSDVLRDIVEDQMIPEGFAQITNVDHSVSTSFPACPGARSGT